MFLSTIPAECFVSAVPHKPMGRYAHIIILRVTDSYALFQTDGELNKARVQAGLNDSSLITRIALFKRKQSSPERLVGRELLRRYRFVGADCPAQGNEIGFVVARQENQQLVIPLEAANKYDWKKNECTAGKGKCAEQRGKDSKSCSVVCDYNAGFCMRCPDCITYGFAIGDSGSERSRVMVDTAYSLLPYDDSHDNFTLNAPYEDGTMSRASETSPRINSQDHIRPQVFFPSVITIKDPTEAMFLYVINNVLRNKSYGAQTTRTGSMRNLIMGMTFTDGEIFSNLKLTQAIYDKVKPSLTPPDPLPIAAVEKAMEETIPLLLADDGVVRKHERLGATFTPVLQEILAIITEEERLQKLLGQAFLESDTFAKRWIFMQTSGEPATTKRGRK